MGLAGGFIHWRSSVREATTMTDDHGTTAGPGTDTVAGLARIAARLVAHRGVGDQHLALDPDAVRSRSRLDPEKAARTRPRPPGSGPGLAPGAARNAAFERGRAQRTRAGGATVNGRPFERLHAAHELAARGGRRAAAHARATSATRSTPTRPTSGTSPSWSPDEGRILRLLLLDGPQPAVDVEPAARSGWSARGCSPRVCR